MPLVACFRSASRRAHVPTSATSGLSVVHCCPTNLTNHLPAFRSSWMPQDGAVCVVFGACVLGRQRRRPEEGASRGGDQGGY